MRKYRYNEQADHGDGNIVVTVTESDILRDYWPYWNKHMLELGRHEQISKENCIEDFVVVHWAWEVKDEPSPVN